MSGPGDLFSLCKEYLVACQEAVAASPGGPIGRAYVSPGPPAWDCIARGTIVETLRGPLPIEEVVAGDYAWAWDERRVMAPYPVTAALAKGERETMVVRTRRRSLRVTDDHRLLVLRLRGRDRQRLNEWCPEWTPAGEVRRGDYVVTSSRIADARLSSHANLDESFAWFLGVFVADGYVTSDGPRICVYGALRERLAAYVRKNWPRAACTPHDQHGLIVYAPEISKTLSGLGLNARSVSRRVPEVVKMAEPSSRRAFLEGYADGDGHRKGNSITYATANPVLAAEVRALHMGLGDNVSNLHVAERRKPIIIKGRLVKNALPLHCFRIHRDSRKKFQEVLNYRGARRALPDEYFTVDRVASVGASEPIDVFDLSVEHAHSFIADGFVVHNCEQLTVHAGGPAEADTLPLQPPLQPGRRSDRTGSVHLANMTATVLRCTPTTEQQGATLLVPSEAALETVAQYTLGDLWAIWNHVRHRYRARTLFVRADGEPVELFFDPAVAVNTSGGLAGWQIQIRVALAGYPGSP